MIIHSDNQAGRPGAFITRLRQAPFVPIIDRFFYSPAYPMLLGVLAFLSCAFSKEIPVYACYCVVFVYLCFFGRDYLPAIPLVVCCYIAPSAANNPGRNEASVFWGESGRLFMVFFIIIVLSVIIRLVIDPEIGGKAFLRKKRVLMPGILALSASYLLAGVGSGHYFDHGLNNLLFVVLQIAGLFLPYFLISGGVKWDKAPRNYLAWTGVCVGFVLIAQTLFLYLTKEVIVDGQIFRGEIYVGWGFYNSIGALLAMMIPFACQLACTSRRGWIWQLCGLVFLMGVFMTCSRASMLTAVLVFAICCLVMAFRARNRWAAVGINIVLLALLLWAGQVYREQLQQLLGNWFANDGSVRSRFEIYKAGIEQFRQYPVFGGTFFPLFYDVFGWATVESMTAFAAPRWHNTIVQLLASGGIVCLLAYGFHRIQTIWLVCKKPTTEVICIGISAAALLIASLMDCHFFNVGPTLFYSMALAFAEHSTESK